MSRLRTIVELAGLGLVGFGCWSIYPPAAWIYAGLATLLVAACWRILDGRRKAERGRPNEPGRWQP